MGEDSAEAVESAQEAAPPPPEPPTFLHHAIMPTEEGAVTPWHDAKPVATGVRPRLFVVYESGDGFELLSNATVAEIIREAEADSRNTVDISHLPALLPALFIPAGFTLTRCCCGLHKPN
jgi:hypothetical protein